MLRELGIYINKKYSKSLPHGYLQNFSQNIEILTKLFLNHKLRSNKFFRIRIQFSIVTLSRLKFLIFTKIIQQQKRRKTSITKN